MRKIIINGGKKLQGEVTVSGAKNSVVALIPAIILSDGVVTLDGVPAISDVDNLIEINWCLFISYHHWYDANI